MTVTHYASEAGYLFVTEPRAALPPASLPFRAAVEAAAAGSVFWEDILLEGSEEHRDSESGQTRIINILWMGVHLKDS